MTLEWGWTASEIPLTCWRWLRRFYSGCSQNPLSRIRFIGGGHTVAVPGVHGGRCRGPLPDVRRLPVVVHWFMRSDVNNHGLWLIPFIALHTLMVGLALYVALKDWRTDLVESRRRARVSSVVVGGIVILLINAKEFYQLGTARSQFVDSVTTGVFFILVIAVCTRFLGITCYWTQSATPEIFPSAYPEEIGTSSGETGVLVIDELERLMQEEKVFREEGFTIRSLGVELGVKEYRLRRLINGHLGYRNFNRFLNEYRVREVARLLVEA